MEDKTFIIEQVTTVTAETADAIKSLAQKIGHNYKELTDTDLDDIVASPNTFLFVAKDESGKIAGMITLLVFRIPYVKKGYLDDLIVDEAYRGMGVAKKLMEHAVHSAKEKGVAYVDLTARPRREAGNGLYEKFGFQKRDTNVYRLLIDYAEV